MMRVHHAGPHALLLEVPDPTSWFEELWRRRQSGDLDAVDIIPGAQTVLLDGVPDPAVVAASVRGWTPPPASAAHGALIEIPVEYGGEDLDFVAQHWHTDVDAVIERMTRTEFQVAFCGFAPGFGYLTGLPPQLAVPRLDTPRARVPAGSVALAGAYTGIYPHVSPGGWRLIGRTEVTLFDPDRDPPALLTPGNRVRLIRRMAR